MEPKPRWMQKVVAELKAAVGSADPHRPPKLKQELCRIGETYFGM